MQRKRSYLKQRVSIYRLKGEHAAFILIGRGRYFKKTAFSTPVTSFVRKSFVRDKKMEAIEEELHFHIHMYK